MFPSIKIILLTLGCASLTLGTFLFSDSRPILLESEESKTAELKPVFNKIVYQPGLKSDIWVMQQSHEGVRAAGHDWDRIAIVVNKSKAEVEYFQLRPGSLSEIDTKEKIEFRANCFMCHPNGPRAIRPRYDSEEAKISAWDKMRIFTWNLRVKSYGKLASVSKGEKIPFRRHEAVLNEELQVGACMKCHKQEGLFSRGALTRQNFMSIKFMLEKGYMPPPGFSLSEEEKIEILKFIGEV